MAEKILIVDDSATVRQQVSLALHQHGFEVEESVDGQAGLERIDDGGISLVICDVNMPRMDGLEMVAKVKAQEQHAALPIIMLTTEGDPNLVKQAKSAGAKGWIVKPFKAELLVKAVQKLTA